VAAAVARVLEATDFALAWVVANPEQQYTSQKKQAAGVVFVHREINNRHTDVVQVVQLVRDAIHYR
jgi:hypothetical protein